MLSVLTMVKQDKEVSPCYRMGNSGAADLWEANYGIIVGIRLASLLLLSLAVNMNLSAFTQVCRDC